MEKERERGVEKSSMEKSVSIGTCLEGEGEGEGEGKGKGEGDNYLEACMEGSRELPRSLMEAS